MEVWYFNAFLPFQFKNKTEVEFGYEEFSRNELSQINHSILISSVVRLLYNVSFNVFFWKVDYNKSLVKANVGNVSARFTINFIFVKKLVLK